MTKQKTSVTETGSHRSLRAKITALVIAVVLLCSVSLSFIGVDRMTTEAQESAVEIMNLTCVNSTTALNEKLLWIENSLSAIAAYVKENVPSDEEIAENPDALDEHVQSVEEYFDSLMSVKQGVYGYYYRYKPEVYTTTGGFFKLSHYSNGDFQNVTPTDITQYDRDDTEHVGWYYIPTRTGRPIWMDPYYNANDGVYTLSYVVPLRDKAGNSYGVVGIDLNFDQIVEAVLDISVYDTGRASLITPGGIIVCHRELEKGTDIRTLGSDFEDIASKLPNASSSGTIYEYNYDGTKMALAFCSVRNGMRFVLAVPESEIYQARNEAVLQYILTALASLAAFAIVAFAAARLMTEPLAKLTEVAKRIGEGERNVEFPPKTGDEIGVLNETMQGMSNSINELVTGLSNKAHVDALTGVRNKRAFEEETLELNNGEERFGFVMFDVNYLKKVNDEYGHEKGDIYIKGACDLICRVFSHCPVYRMGGDEFIAVLREGNVDMASYLMSEMDRRAYEINQEASEPWEKIDCAKGLAIYDPKYDNMDDPVRSTFKQADESMYSDKRGRHRE